MKIMRRPAQASKSEDAPTPDEPGWLTSEQEAMPDEIAEKLTPKNQAEREETARRYVCHQGRMSSTAIWPTVVPSRTTGTY